DTVTEGSLVSAAGRTVPRRVVEHRQQTGTALGDLGTLVGELGGVAVNSLGDSMSRVRPGTAIGGGPRRRSIG
ncbi:MAG TPA: hypothetical protein VIK05_06690, partial [Ilumatobacteraceae bacterium]